MGNNREIIQTMIEQDEDKDGEYYVENEKFERIELETVKNGYKLRDGVPFVDIIRNLSLVKSMELREDDIFSIGYPKSGKNFYQIINKRE